MIWLLIVAIVITNSTCFDGNITVEAVARFSVTRAQVTTWKCCLGLMGSNLEFVTIVGTILLWRLDKDESMLDYNALCTMVLVEGNLCWL